MAQILDGLKVSHNIKKEIKEEVDYIIAKGGKSPHLAAILVGENGASKAYVNSKVKDCKEVGFTSTLVKFSESITEEELLAKIQELNENPEIDGFIVQLPLPKHMNQEKVIMAIDPSKDVDGFHPENFGKMALEMEAFLPATPFGMLELLERYKIETQGKHCVVIGRSRIVGKPMSILMGRKGNPGNATITMAHSYTPNIEELTKQADIVITALGKPNFLKGEMLKEGAVIIDVGITRVDDDSEKGYKLVGDVDFEDCKEKASYITPVPGGVGPMTRAMLMKNTLLAYKNNSNYMSNSKLQKTFRGKAVIVTPPSVVKTYINGAKQQYCIIEVTECEGNTGFIGEKLSAVRVIRAKGSTEELKKEVIQGEEVYVNIIATRESEDTQEYTIKVFVNCKGDFPTNTTR